MEFTCLLAKQALLHFLPLGAQSVGTAKALCGDRAKFGSRHCRWADSNCGLSVNIERTLGLSLRLLTMGKTEVNQAGDFSTSSWTRG